MEGYAGVLAQRCCWKPGWLNDEADTLVAETSQKDADESRRDGAQALARLVFHSGMQKLSTRRAIGPDQSRSLPVARRKVATTISAPVQSWQITLSQ
jgi:hypothetical protein